MKVKVAQACPTLLHHGLHSRWYSPGQNTGVGNLSLLQGTFPTQGWNPGLFALQVKSLPTEAQGKPKNIGVGSLSLLQQIFPTHYKMFINKRDNLVADVLVLHYYLVTKDQHYLGHRKMSVGVAAFSCVLFMKEHFDFTLKRIKFY